MPQQIYVLNTVTPLFLYGADQKNPEIRAASIRGQFHYWFRAIEGARTDDLKEISASESALFGSTAGGSSVSIRVSTDKDLKTDTYPMLPHKKDKREQSWQKAASPGQKLRLTIATRPGMEKVPPAVTKTVLIWLLLGGIGKRSRRMFGALEWPKLISQDNDSAGPAAEIKQYLEKWVRYADLPHVPAFPTLHPSYSRVVVGTRGSYEWEALMKELFGLLRNDRYRPKERTFGYATATGDRRDRRASPLIAQVRRIGDQYYPVLTAMRSTPDKDIKWEVLDQFMDDAQALWKGETVWGGRLA